MQKIMNAMTKQAIRAMQEGRADTRMGIVTSYDPIAYAVIVKIMPEEVLTGWLPVLSPWTGNGFGFYAGPNIDDQVMVLHLEGDFGSGIVIGRVNDDSHRPPAVPSGEAWAVHSSGSYLKFLTDGTVEINSTETIKVGNLANAVLRLVNDSFKALFNGHTHGNVQNGGGVTNVPVTPMTDEHLTAKLKAN